VFDSGRVRDELPEAWRKAWEREAAGLVTPLADPGPERRVARLLGAFIGSGLLFLALPGTLVGVWNLLAISAARQASRAPALWVQAHGHAQLFGWVGSFMIGICLYAAPKFRGGAVRSLLVGWLMFGLWTSATAAHWAAVLWLWRWRQMLTLAALAQLMVVLLLIWQTTASGRSRTRTELWNIMVDAGLLGFAGTMLWQLVIAIRLRAETSPIIPPGPDQILLTAALWLFCLPVAWGFSIRFLPAFLGLPQPRRNAALGGLVALAPALFWPRALTLAAALLVCYSLRVFEPAVRKAKVQGLYRHYPLFVRFAFGWLVISALLVAAGEAPGVPGASRHAFTVGFLATLIFSIGPRILPSFLNSRELWSPRLMRWSLVLLTAGCTLRVISEPLAYGNALALFWSLLPFSACMELTAVLLFAFNIGRTLSTPMPAWFMREQIKDTMPLYWYVTSYPASRRVLTEAGIKTLAQVREIPKSLTLREAAEAEGVDSAALVQKLGDFFEARLASTLRSHA
jgi:NnrS protein